MAVAIADANKESLVVIMHIVKDWRITSFTYKMPYEEGRAQRFLAQLGNVAAGRLDDRAGLPKIPPRAPPALLDRLVEVNDPKGYAERKAALAAKAEEWQRNVAETFGGALAAPRLDAAVEREIKVTRDKGVEKFARKAHGAHRPPRLTWRRSA